MTRHRIGLDLSNDVLDVLHRHGFARGDSRTRGRAIFLIGDLARIYEGSRTTPTGPPSPRRHICRRHPSGPARNPNLDCPSPRTIWTPSRSPMPRSGPS